MTNRNFRGIVVRTVDYLESDRLLTVLTFEEGSVTIKAKGVRKQKAKLSFAAGQFFCGDFECIGKSGRYVLTGASRLYDYSALAEDIERYYHACHFIDIASFIIMEDHPDEEILRFLLNSLHILTMKKSNLTLLTAIFELRAAVISGFAPMIDECAVCGRKTDSSVFSVLAGGFVCCSSGVETDKDIRKAVEHIATAEVSKLFSMEVSGESVRKLKDITGSYIETVFDRRFRTLDQLEGI